MHYIKFSATINTKKTANQALASLLDLFREDLIEDIRVSKTYAENPSEETEEQEETEEESSYEESSSEESSSLEEIKFEEPERDLIRALENSNKGFRGFVPKAKPEVDFNTVVHGEGFKVDWGDPLVSQDLISMGCKDFCAKYDVFRHTYYYNLKKRKTSIEEGMYSHSRTEFSLAMLNPSKFLSHFGYTEKELPKIQSVAKNMLKKYYDGKYPEISNYAGKFRDKAVGSKYSIGASTVCNIRKMLGVPAFKAL